MGEAGCSVWAGEQGQTGLGSMGGWTGLGSWDGESAGRAESPGEEPVPGTVRVQSFGARGGHH